MIWHTHRCLLYRPAIFCTWALFPYKVFSYFGTTVARHNHARCMPWHCRRSKPLLLFQLPSTGAPSWNSRSQPYLRQIPFASNVYVQLRNFFHCRYLHLLHPSGTPHYLCCHILIGRSVCHLQDHTRCPRISVLIVLRASICLTSFIWPHSFRVHFHLLSVLAHELLFCSRQAVCTWGPTAFMLELHAQARLNLPKHNLLTLPTSQPNMTLLIRIMFLISSQPSANESTTVRHCYHPSPCSRTLHVCWQWAKNMLLFWLALFKSGW